MYVNEKVCSDTCYFDILRPKHQFVKIPSLVYLNELLGRVVMGRATDEEQSLVRHWDAMVTEGVDMGIISRPHRDLHHFNTWAHDIQTVLLKSANDGALHDWLNKYDEECTANRAARENQPIVPIIK